jgi:hypothetical protein
MGSRLSLDQIFRVRPPYTPLNKGAYRLTTTITDYLTHDFAT